MSDDHSGAPPMDLRVLATLAIQGAMPALAAAFESRTSTKLAIKFAPTNALMTDIKTGVPVDVAVLTQEAAHALAKAGATAAPVDLAASYVGLAVKAGAPKPDIGSREALVATFLSAKSIAYSRIGASGVFFAGLIQRLGIADQVNAKATIIPQGFTAELAASGTCELAVQQVSELMMVRGIDVVGPLPPDVQTPTLFSGCVFRNSGHRAVADQFLAFLASPEAAPHLTASGLEPIRR
jgi:molybdate transport system substrate-binding protein